MLSRYYAKRRRQVADKALGIPLVLWCLVLDHLTFDDLMATETSCRTLRRHVVAYAKGRAGTRTLRERLLPERLFGSYVDRDWTPLAQSPWSTRNKQSLATFERIEWPRHTTGHVAGAVHNRVTGRCDDKAPPDPSGVISLWINLLAWTWRDVRMQLAIKTAAFTGKACVILPGFLRYGNVCITPAEDTHLVVLHASWKARSSVCAFLWLPPLRHGLDSEVHVYDHRWDIGGVGAPLSQSQRSFPVSTHGDMNWFDLQRLVAFELQLDIQRFRDHTIQWNGRLDRLFERHGAALCLDEFSGDFGEPRYTLTSRRYCYACSRAGLRLYKGPGGW